MISNENGDGTTTNMDSRTARMLKRQRLTASKLNSDEETELKSSGLLEDGMTNKMKKDLLKALFASRESAKVEKSTFPSLTASRNGAESPELFASDSQFKSDEDSNETTSKKFKPNSETDLIDKRTHKESGCATMYAPVGVDADRYSKVIRRSLERYYKRLSEVQNKSVDFVPWGLPVVVGERIKQSLDAVGSRKRNRFTPKWDNTFVVKTKNVMSLSDSDEDDSNGKKESSEEEFEVKKCSVPLRKVWLSTTNKLKKKTKLDELHVMEIEDDDSNKSSKKEKSNQAKADKIKKSSAAGTSSSSLDVMCPLCGRMFESNEIEQHASDCLGAEEPLSQNGGPELMSDDKVILIFNSDDDGEEEKMTRKVSNDLEHCYFCKMDIPKFVFDVHVRNCFGSSKNENVSASRQPDVSVPSNNSVNLLSQPTRIFYGSGLRSPNSFELPTIKSSMAASKKTVHSRKSKD